MEAEERPSAQVKGIAKARLLLEVIASLTIAAYGVCNLLIQNGHIILVSLYDLIGSRIIAASRRLWQRLQERAQTPFYSDYLYTPLREGEIRLLTLKHGRRTDPLSCTLHHVLLADRPKYIAASYTWQRNRIWPGLTFVALALLPGVYVVSMLAVNILLIVFASDTIRVWIDWMISMPFTAIASVYAPAYNSLVADKSCAIICNGRRLMIRENLYEFLLELRSSANQGQSWIDAICVNQTDVAERNRQILLMNAIYTAAEEVITWLGPCPLLLDSPWTMGSVQSHFKTSDFEVKIHPAQLAMRIPLRACARYYILGRPYFSRAWVIQEFLLAEKVSFWLGRHRLSPEDMRSVINLTDLSIASKAHMICFSSVGMVDLLLKAREQFRAVSSMSLRDYLVTVLGHQATDPRDLVYAGLGLLTESSTSSCTVIRPEKFDEDQLHNPDYSAEAIDVFVSCAITLFQEIGLDALSFGCVGNDRNHLVDVSLPSWVPHISELHDYPPICRHDDIRFSTGGPSSLAEVNVTPDLQLLVQSGASHFDTVETVSRNASTGGEIADVVHGLLETRFTYDGTGECMVTAVARTVIADGLQGSRMNSMLVTEGLLRMLLRSLSADVKGNGIEAKLTGILGPWGSQLPRLMAVQDAESATVARERKLRLKQAFEEGGSDELNTQRLVGLCQQNLSKAGYQNSVEQTALAVQSSDVGLQDEVIPAGQGEEAVDESKLLLSDARAATSDDLGRTKESDWFWKWLTTEATSYETAVKNRMHRRALFVTKQGYIGIGSKYLEQGDHIMILSGAKMPYAMHAEEVEGEIRYHMRGEVYLHGVMDGEITRRDDWNPRPIVIV